MNSLEVSPRAGPMLASNTVIVPAQEARHADTRPSARHLIGGSRLRSINLLHVHGTRQTAIRSVGEAVTFAAGLVVGIIIVFASAVTIDHLWPGLLAAVLIIGLSGARRAYGVAVGTLLGAGAATALFLLLWSATTDVP